MSKEKYRLAHDRMNQQQRQAMSDLWMKAINHDGHAWVTFSQVEEAVGDFFQIGEWEGDGTCPFCQERPLGRYATIKNFCPNCGADLRGGNA